MSGSHWPRATAGLDPGSTGGHCRPVWIIRLVDTQGGWHNKQIGSRHTAFAVHIVSSLRGNHTWPCEVRWLICVCDGRHSLAHPRAESTAPRATADVSSGRVALSLECIEFHSS